MCCAGKTAPNRWALPTAFLCGLSLPAAGVETDARLEGNVARHIESGDLEAAARTAARHSDDRLQNDLLTRVARARTSGRGGGPEVDFEQLINLITTTIAPDTWEEVGGAGAISGFEGGVSVDANGLLTRIRVPSGADGPLEGNARAPSADNPDREVRQPSRLRKVSLNRLERVLMVRRALGRPIEDALRLLAGIYRLRYVMLFPDSGDVVLAGPAGPWRRDAEGRVVNADTGQPVLHLDDLIVLIRNALSSRGRFGCSITPLRENLRRTQAFLAVSRQEPIPAGPASRTSWIKQLQSRVGRQRIDVYGIDAHSRTARILVEADYRMKLIGMGLEPSVAGVPSYLELIEPDNDGKIPPLRVLRWWFTLHNASLSTNTRRTCYELHGPRVRVLSENELLSRSGRRIATGKAEEWNRAFARNFTAHFDALADVYPVYADLRNVFDLALAVALILEEDLAGRADWSLTYFGDRSTGGGMKYAVAGVVSPREVESVINHRVLDKQRFVVGVSGGVRVDTARHVRGDRIQSIIDPATLYDAHRRSPPPPKAPLDPWWWD